MEKIKNMAIVVLIIILGVSLYFIFQDTGQIKTEGEAVNSFSDGAIPPSQALRAAFDESSQHSVMADIAELPCFPTSRYDCSSLRGCVSVAPATYYFVDYGTESGTYFRCDEKGCDNYPVEVVQSGIYTEFIPRFGHSTLFKVAGDNPLVNKGEFIDVATIGTMTLVSFGKCESVK